MRVPRRAALAALLMLAGCTLPHPKPPPPSAAGARTPAQLLASVQAAAQRIDQSEAGARAALVAAASASARQCLAQAPNDAACQYAQAQALGLTAREHPIEAPGLLKQMLASLARAEALDPGLDHAGPARLSAVVLMRAPPWPLGPGDVEAATAAAQRAVQREPGYPPNLIALAEAQSKSAGAAAARASFNQAQQALDGWQGAPEEPAAQRDADRAQWRASIAQGLQELR